jgi:hypothetical protein
VASGKGKLAEAGIFKAAKAFFRSFGKDAHLAQDAAHARPRFTLREMDPHYSGEHLPAPNKSWTADHLGGSQVQYLDEAGRQRYRLTVGSDGRLYDSAGRRFDTSGGTSAWSRGRGRAIFVMDEQGNLYASNRQIVGQFHHSSFLGGNPVAGAGELEVADGNLMAISRQSGHYKPQLEHLQQTVDHLRGQGLVFGNHHIEWGI